MTTFGQTGKAQNEQMFSALPQQPDSFAGDQHFRVGPKAAVSDRGKWQDDRQPALSPDLIRRPNPVELAYLKAPALRRAYIFVRHHADKRGGQSLDRFRVRRIVTVHG